MPSSKQLLLPPWPPAWCPRSPTAAQQPTDPLTSGIGVLVSLLIPLGAGTASHTRSAATSGPLTLLGCCPSLPKAPSQAIFFSPEWLSLTLLWPGGLCPTQIFE